MRYLFVLYFIIGAIALAFGIAGLINSDTSVGAYIGIVAIGAYFIGRGFYLARSRKYGK